LKRWYVVASEPAEERRARDELSALGFEAFCPMDRTHGRDRFTKKWRIFERPLLTGYLFVSLDLGVDAWGEARRARFVRALLPVSAMRPLPVRQGVVEAFQAADVASSTITLEEMLGQARRRSQRPSRKEGEAVRVTSGPFASMVGEVKRDDGGDTLRLIMGWLEVDVPAQIVEAA
jgi:transcription antitermination factor NusG